MTGRQRVLAALNFRQSDKIPLDINAHPSSGINVTAYRNLRKYLELPPATLYIYDFVQQLAVVEKDILDYFDADTYQLGCDAGKTPEYWKDWRLEDGTPCKIPSAFSPHAHNFLPSQTHSSLLRETAAETRDSTDRAIYGVFGGSLAETGFSVFGTENFLEELLTSPDRIHKFLDDLTEEHMENLKTYLDAAGNYIDIIGFNDDMCAQHAPLFSPDIYKDFFFLRQKKMWSYIHENFPELKICLHCCGAARQLMPLFAEAGLDALNPVQYSYKDMALKDLKNEFRGKLTLWGGGCGPESMFSETKPEDVRLAVRENIAIMNNGGGFVFQPVHNVLHDMPAENITVMYNTVREFSI